MIRALFQIVSIIPAETVNIMIPEQIIASITDTVQHREVGSDNTEIK